jgi:hypothetical protein
VLTNTRELSRAVRVHRAVKEIDGMTGMAMIRVIVKGEGDSLKLEMFRLPSCKKIEHRLFYPMSGVDATVIEAIGVGTIEARLHGARAPTHRSLPRQGRWLR